MDPQRGGDREGAEAHRRGEHEPDEARHGVRQDGMPQVPDHGRVEDRIGGQAGDDLRPAGARWPLDGRFGQDRAEGLVHSMLLISEIALVRRASTPC